MKYLMGYLAFCKCFSSIYCLNAFSNNSTIRKLPSQTSFHAEEAASPIAFSESQSQKNLDSFHTQTIKTRVFIYEKHRELIIKKLHTVLACLLSG